MSTGARDLQSELLAASKTGNLKAVKTLVEIGANINATDAMGQTALHFAAYNEQVELCEYLVLNGVNTDCEANDGMTAYQLAVAEDLEDVAKIIRERTRDVKALRAKDLSPEALKAELRALWETAQRNRGIVEEKRAGAQAIAEEDKRAGKSGAEAAQQEPPPAKEAPKKPLTLISPKAPKKLPPATKELPDDSDASGTKLPAVPGASEGGAAEPKKKTKVPPPQSGRQLQMASQAQRRCRLWWQRLQLLHIRVRLRRHRYRSASTVRPPQLCP